MTEGAFVSAWHREVSGSVHDVLDPGSLRSAAAGALEWGKIGSTTGYLRVNRFGGFTSEPSPRSQQIDALHAALADALDDLAETRVLVLDVALNGGGNDAAAMTIASYFADRARDAVIYDYAHDTPRATRLVPADSVYERPIFLLTSEVTASAAEAFVLAMRSLPHVTHVGERTRGGISSLLPKPFPGGFLVTISYERVLDAEGHEFEGVGIPPDVPIALFPDSDLHGGFATALRSLAASPPFPALMDTGTPGD
ncbi:MAG: S41 family peptidase [Planctomycetota bacterium]